MNNRLSEVEIDKTDLNTPDIYDLRIWKRFLDIAKPFWFSEKRWKAFALLATILLLPIAGQKASAYFNSLAAKSTTALQTRNPEEYNHLLFQMPFALVAMVVSIAFLMYFMSRLDLEWQLWLTTRFLGKYFKNRSFYHISGNVGIDNPDQRICDSVGQFTGLCVFAVTIFYNSIVTLFIHTSVLWNISPRLTIFLLIYVLIGTVGSALFGKRLIRLNFLELQKGADFRYGLVHVRENVESIAFYGGEEREKADVTGRLLGLISIKRSLISWERYLELFTSCHGNYKLLLIYMVIGPLVMVGKLPFGDIVWTEMTLFPLYGALIILAQNIRMFGLIATETSRLETLESALDQAAIGSAAPGATLIRSQVGSRLSLKNVTVQTPDYRQTVVTDITAEVPTGRGLLISGPSGVGKSSLLRAVAGLWNAGEGEITRPPLEEMFFLPQRPYMMLGSLREQLLYPAMNSDTSDSELQGVLEKVHMEDMPERFGGFDIVMDWKSLLSPGEQQRLAFARLLLARPGYAVLDEATSALDVNNEARLYGYLKESGTTFVSVGHRPTLLDYHDKVLELQGGGRWRFLTADEFRLGVAA